MAKRFIITIGREFGSGGRETGLKVAEKLGVKCYDEEILRESAKETDLHESYLETMDERSPGLFSVPPTHGLHAPELQPPSIKAYLAQFEAIRKIASRENCVIIGRCADHILTGESGLFNFFIYADTGSRTERIRNLRGCSEKEAKVLMLKEDRKRAAYYEYYTDKKWGARRSYDMCINTSRFTVDGAAEIIVNTVKNTPK